ncbi:hypothetical protein SRABI06_02145 [Pseudomonas brassicacearum]|nr:hypothetical protein SRABI06_02145 [Pseudomonas brassicacearum]
MMDSKPTRSHPLPPLTCVPASPTSLHKRIHRRAANQRARL